MLSDQTKKILARIDEGKRLIDAHRPLPPSVLARLREQLVLDWTYNSNAIEGNTLTIKETMLVIQEGLTIGRKSLVEHLEAINHRDAIGFIEELAQEKGAIQERNIRKIHGIILKEIDPHYAGRYRDIQVRISGSSHTPPPALKVPELMAEFGRQHLGSSEMHPVCQAALAHFRLIDIHPFTDGNGRTARLLMNLQLIKSGYFPAVILKNDRLKYYACLEKAHKGQVDDFIIFVARALERTIYLYMEAIPGLTEGFLSLAEAAKRSPYSKEYLGVLARRGGIPAFKLRRNWLIAVEALEEYVGKSGRKLS